MSQQIKELKKDLFLKNAQVATFKKMSAINPLQNDFDRLKKTLYTEEKEKNSLIMENHGLRQRLQDTSDHCKNCVNKHKTSTTSSTQTEVTTTASPPSLTMAAPESGLVLKVGRALEVTS
jgi:regulator of replication initiation timing